jgi:two-component system, response regulator PdtaR
MKVLVIDDEELIRASLRRVFEMRGHEVHASDNGREGLELWRKVSPDLVVLDVLMPSLTGPQVLANIGDIGSTKVILISAYTGEFNVQRAEELGASLFLPKPFHNIFEVVDRAEKLVKNENVRPLERP